MISFGKDNCASRVALGISFALAACAALAVDMPAGYTHLGWIESNSAKQWIDSGYVPQTSTVVRASFQAKTRSENWSEFFGSLNNDSSANAVTLRYYNGSYTLNGLFCNTTYGEAQIADIAGNGVDIDVELKSGSFTANGNSVTITTVNNPYQYSMYIFCGRNGSSARRHQPMRLYSMKIAEIDPATSEETPKRDFLPCKNLEGKYGLWDSVAGVFYGNQASGNDFVGGGIEYVVDASGVITVSHGGTMSAAEFASATALEVNCSGEALNIGSVAALPATTVTAGALSFQDNAARAHSINGALTLASGASLVFDVTGSGADVLSPTSVVFGGTPVTIAVNPVGVTEISEALTLIEGSFTAGDLAKFTLSAALPAELGIEDGNLVLLPKAADAAVWTGTSGNWSTDANWQDNAKPANGAPVTFSNAAGGTVVQDMSGLSIKSLAIDATSGSFTQSGSALTISSSIDSRSTAAQALSMPLTLGVAGKTFSVSSAGNLDITGAMTVNASRLSVAPEAGATNTFGAISGSGTLAKSGSGTLRLSSQSPSFLGDIEITGGTVLGSVLIPFPNATPGAKISISNGGTLDLGPSSLAQDSIKYTSRQLELAGSGVDGKGAVVYAGGSLHQYYAFNNAKLTADATVGCESGRWDVRNQNSVGLFDFNGHSLTKVGAGMVAFSNVQIVTGDDPVALNVNEGTVLVENGTTLAGSENTINVAAGGRLQMYSLGNPIAWAMNFAGGSTFDSQEMSTSGNRLSGPMALGAGDVTFSVKQYNRAYVESAVSGTGKLLKTSPGELYLTGGAKTYSGGTEVAAGRLYVAAKDQLPGYDVPGNVSITGENAGIVLSSTGWGTGDFLSFLDAATLSNMKSHVGYENAGSEPIAISSAISKSLGGVLLDGASAELAATGGISLPDGCLIAAGNAVLSGEDAEVKRAELSGRNTTLTVRDGATLKLLGRSENVNDLKFGDEWTTPSSIHRVVVENATITCDPLPVSGSKSSGILYGTCNNGVGILEVKAGGVVAHKLCGATFEWSRAAAYVDAGGTLTNYGGTGNNDGYISGSGYGYLENAGTTTFKGYSQVVNGSTRSVAVGLLYSNGDVYFTQDFGGELDISRGGTGVVYQTSGRIEATKGGFQFNSQHGAGSGGLAVWTVEGAATVAKGAYFYPANKNNATSILNLREGGTIDYGVISPRNNNYTSVAAQPFYVNFAGGFMKPQNSGFVFKQDDNEPGRYSPNKVVAFEGGAGFDIGEGLSCTLNVAVERPTGRGIASITPSAAALAQDYIGAPYVQIMGDGYGATAVALYDKSTRRITGIKVTSPGCNYTTATVILTGGRADNNNLHEATATLTADGASQVAGGLVKKGAGTLAVSAATLPDFTSENKVPLAVLGGTLDLGAMTYYASELTIAGGASVANGTVVADGVKSIGNAVLTSNVTLSDGATITLAASDLLAGRHLSFDGAASFAPGTTVTIEDFDDLDLENTAAMKFVLLEASAIEGFDNLTFSPAAPKGWAYRLSQGGKLVLARKTGLAVFVR